MNRISRFIFTLTFAASVLTAGAFTASDSARASDFVSCDPSSEFLESPDGGPTVDFCSKWNPEFTFRGHQCCAKVTPGASVERVKGKKGRRRRRVTRDRCAPDRIKGNYCDEMTAEQKQYSEDAVSGKLGDLLKLITFEMGKKGPQSYCTVNNGFIANGRRIVPTDMNRVLLRSPERCSNFGTDGMAGMIEWLGREIAVNYTYKAEFSNLHLIVGDVSAPRGGCMLGKNGRRGHASHTAGLDADIGFFNPFSNHRYENNFTKVFIPNTNWWFLKKIFKNPFACVKVIFLDRKLIARLSRVAGSDPDWANYRKFIRHVRGHDNHLHVRLGSHPGQPGCVANPMPELESVDENEAEDFSGIPGADETTGESDSDESGDPGPEE
ncbi:MAG: penicillin-insensitive murein endopeptidase [Methylotenera sp.]|nr:penicillin-insensitive murein endopeptidase [Oligoflexia bacterium]